LQIWEQQTAAQLFSSSRCCPFYFCRSGNNKLLLSFLVAVDADPFILSRSGNNKLLLSFLVAGDADPFIFCRSGNNKLLLSFDCVPLHLRAIFQQKIYSVRRKDAEAIIEADAELARSIIMDSMLAAPFFGGAGAVLSITTTSGSASSSSRPSTEAAAQHRHQQQQRQRRQQPIVHNDNGDAPIVIEDSDDVTMNDHNSDEDDDNSAASYTFHVVHNRIVQQQPNSRPPSSEDQVVHQQQGIMPAMTMTPVHLVVYLYGATAAALPRHITTLEFPLLNVDNITYIMRERQVLFLPPSLLPSGAQIEMQCFENLENVRRLHP
jgi:hypothetical protein